MLCDSTFVSLNYGTFRKNNMKYLFQQTCAEGSDFSTCTLLLCWSTFCCQNTPNPPNLGPDQAPEGLLWYLAPGREQQILKGLSVTGGASTGWTCFFSTSHRCSIWWRSGEFRGQVKPVNIRYCLGNQATWCLQALDAFCPGSLYGLKIEESQLQQLETTQVLNIKWDQKLKVLTL